MQEDLNERLNTLGEEDAKISEEERAESLARLSIEQGELAESALKLSQPTEEAPEDDPEKLPDIRPDDKSRRPRNQPGAAAPPVDGPPSEPLPGQEEN